MMRSVKLKRYKPQTFATLEGLNRAAEAAGEACCSYSGQDSLQEGRPDFDPSGAQVLLVLGLSLSCTFGLLGWFMA